MVPSATERSWVSDVQEVETGTTPGSGNRGAAAPFDSQLTPRVARPVPDQSRARSPSSITTQASMTTPTLVAVPAKSSGADEGTCAGVDIRLDWRPFLARDQDTEAGQLFPQGTCLQGFASPIGLPLPRASRGPSSRGSVAPRSSRSFEVRSQTALSVDDESTKGSRERAVTRTAPIPMATSWAWVRSCGGHA